MAVHGHDQNLYYAENEGATNIMLPFCQAAASDLSDFKALADLVGDEEESSQESYPGHETEPSDDKVISCFPVCYTLDADDMATWPHGFFSKTGHGDAEEVRSRTV